MASSTTLFFSFQVDFRARCACNPPVKDVDDDGEHPASHDGGLEAHCHGEDICPFSCDQFKPEHADSRAPSTTEPSIRFQIQSRTFKIFQIADAKWEAASLFRQVETVANVCDISHEKCGMSIQVHPDGGMDVPLAQKAVTLVLLLENQLLSQLCAPCRRDPESYLPVGIKSALATRRLPNNDFFDEILGGDTDEMFFHLPWTQSDLKPAPWNSRQPGCFHDTLRVIWKAKSTESILTYLLTHKREACAFTLGIGGSSSEQTMQIRLGEKAPEYAGGTPATFEFRYPESTFEAEFLIKWAVLSGKIMHIACLDKARYKDKLKAIWKVLDKEHAHNRPAWPALLRCIGLEAQTSYWNIKLHRYGRERNGPQIGRE